MKKSSSFRQTAWDEDENADYERNKRIWSAWNEDN